MENYVIRILFRDTELPIIFHTFNLCPGKTSNTNIKSFVYIFLQFLSFYVFHHTFTYILNICVTFVCWYLFFSLLLLFFFITFLTWLIFFLILSTIQPRVFFLVMLPFMWFLPCLNCNRDNATNIKVWTEFWIIL